MSVFGKLKFWKRDDDFGFEKIANQGFDESDLPQSDDLGLDKKPVGTEEKSPFDEQEKTSSFDETQVQKPSLHPAAMTGSPQRDLELLNSKLDTIKALLTSLDQRIANIERNSGTEQKPQQKLW